jgi:hypothetical protein
MTGTVRPLEERDIPQIAELHEKVLGKAINGSAPSLPARLSRIFLHHPWPTESLPSWVFEDGRGRVVGCIGAVPRPMSFNGRRILAAISHSFIVDPDSRSTLAAVALAQKFLAGPQELSLAEGNAVSRTILERAGGSTSLLYSLCWTRPLRPGRYVLSFLNKRGMPPAARWTLLPFCQLADALTPLIARKPFKLAEPAVSGAELDADTLQRAVGEFTLNRSLRPHYDPQTLAWLLETLAQMHERGSLQKVVVRNAQRETVGWYLYYGKPGGVGTVVQIGAKDGCAEDVLDHLFLHARQRGMVAVSGQVDPAYFHLYSRRDCVFHHDGGSWILVHARVPELRHAIDRGDAFLTRLEGEWWIGSLLSPNP